MRDRRWKLDFHRPLLISHYMAALVCRLFVTRHIHALHGPSDSHLHYVSLMQPLALCIHYGKHHGNIQQRLRPFIFKRSGCQGGIIYLQRITCTTENVPLIKDEKASLHYIQKGSFSISHRLKTAAYISILSSTELFPNVKLIYRTMSFWVKNTEASRTDITESVSVPAALKEPAILQKPLPLGLALPSKFSVFWAFLKKIIKKHEDAYLHRTRQGRSVGGTTGSCWEAVHHFLLSPLPPGKHLEDWQLSPAPRCCHQGAAVLQLGVRTEKSITHNMSTLLNL